MDIAKYTNRFTVVSNPQSSEFIITFYQTMPILGEDGSITSTETVEAGRYVMNAALAKEFASTVSELADRIPSATKDER